MKSKLVLILTFLICLALTLPAAALAGGEDASQQEILKELKALKAKLSEMDKLKARVQELETRLAASEKNAKQAKKMASQTQEKSKGLEVKLADATKFKIGGAFRFNYRNTDYNDVGKAKGGDMTFDIFRLDVKGQHNDLILDVQYRWYSYMDVIHHGWVGYNFNENWQGQLGVTQVPFGLLPYASHNWWFSLAYYVGLEDDYDMGFKTVYKKGPFDLQMAFFKNDEWGNSAKLERYSFDVVRSGDQQNEETNQLNARFAYTLKHAEKYSTELGVSGQWGQLYNRTTDSNGSHWAAAAHINGNYGPFNLMLQAAKYKYDPDNPSGVSDRTVQMGAFAADYAVASEAMVYIAGLAYTVPVSWGPITSLQFYNDYSHIAKDESGFEDSQLNTLGFLISANPVYIYVDWVYGKNAIWVGGPGNSMAEGDPDADWHSLFNINVGYYF
jgi:hypothetical protein